MTGKTLNIKIFVTGENLEKLAQIREHLNKLEDVQNGNAERWTKTATYEAIFNFGIENYKF